MKFKNRIISNASDSNSDHFPDDAAEIPNTPYARVLETHTGQDYIDRVTQVFQEIGVKEWLEENPLSRLELSRELRGDFGNLINGMYSFIDRTIQIATKRSRDEYGKIFEWQRVHSVSSVGDTAIETVKRTLIHELGHHIHNTLRNTDMEAFQKTLAVNFLAGGTQYAQCDKYEYFAELFALYVYHRPTLRLRDPQGYATIETALACIGLEVNPL